MVAGLRLGVADAVLDLAGLADGGGGGPAVSVGIAAVVAVVVLGPLVVISLNLAGVLLVVVGFGGDGVVRLAPSAVEVAAIGLLGPLVVIVAGTGSGVVAGSLSVLVGAVAALASGGLSTVSLSVANALAVSLAVATVSTDVLGSLDGAVLGSLSSGSSAVGVVVSGGGSLANRGGTVDIAVLAPSLGTVLIVILVVPFVIGLGIVGFGPGAVVRFLDGEILVTTISIPVGSGLAPVARLARLRGSVVLGTLLAQGRSTVVSVSVSGLELVGFLAPLGGSLSVGTSVTRVVSIVVLSPLVIIGLDGSGVALAVVRLGGDRVVGLAPSGVVVGAVSLLGPLIVVVSTSGGLLGGGSALPDHLVTSVSGSGGLLGGVSGFVTVGTVSVSTVSTVAERFADLGGLGASGTVSSLGGILGGGNGTVGGSAIDISVLAPGLCAPLVIVSVVPLIVGFSGVSLSGGAVVGNVLSVVLITSPGVPVGARLAPVVLAALLGSSGAFSTLAVAGTLAVGRGRGSLAVSVTLTSIVSVVVLSPLIVVGADTSGVVLVVVGLGLNGVIRLAPSGVVVRAIGLLGPDIVVVATTGGTVAGAGTLPDLTGGGTVVRLSVGRVELLATVLGALGGTGLTVAVVVARGGGLSVGGGTVDITVLTPGLSAPLVVVGVVPLVIRLSGVGLGGGAAIGLLDGEVLVSAIGIEVGGRSLFGLLAVALGGTLSTVARLLGDLDDGSGLVVGWLVAISLLPGVDGSNEESESESFHVGWRMFKLYNLSLLGLLNDAEPLF